MSCNPRLLAARLSPSGVPMDPDLDMPSRPASMAEEVAEGAELMIQKHSASWDSTCSEPLSRSSRDNKPPHLRSTQWLGTPD